MKHIKKFLATIRKNESSDNQIQKYHKNDYVKLKASGFVDNLPRYTKITSVDPPTYDNIIFYLCVTPDNVDYWMTNERIERELDKYEIEKYKLDSISNKFNI